MPKKAKAIQSKSRNKAVPAPTAIPSKPKVVKPKIVKARRNYDKSKFMNRRTGNRTKSLVVHNAAVNLAHARWAVTPKQYQVILHKIPKLKPKTIKPKVKPLTRSTTKTKNVDAILFGDPIPKKKRRSTRKT